MDKVKPQFTKKQLAAIEKIAHGRSYDQAAFDLGISRSAIDKTISTVRCKLRASTTIEAVYKLAKAGLICVIGYVSMHGNLDEARRPPRPARIVRVMRRSKDE